MVKPMVNFIYFQLAHFSILRARGKLQELYLTARSQQGFSIINPNHFSTSVYMARLKILPDVSCRSLLAENEVVSSEHFRLNFKRLRLKHLRSLLFNLPAQLACSEVKSSCRFVMGARRFVNT